MLRVSGEVDSLGLLNLASTSVTVVEAPLQRDGSSAQPAGAGLCAVLTARMMFSTSGWYLCVYGFIIATSGHWSVRRLG
jgi:hypothetical protein